ncbi:MAG: polysaccharide deacetylase family protein [Myxococcales bacterium]|nr:polysaccharide deacetylase family protein [Myxococcales bacterium]
MRRGILLQLAVAGTLLVELLVVPRSAWAPTLLVTLALASAGIAYLVTSTRTQFLVPTIFRGSGNERTLAFTFDDGPDPVFTPKVLDLLREHDAKATFFVVGKRADAHPDLVLRAIREGHTVGSHTYSHAHTFHFWRAHRMASDVRRGIDSVVRITGRAPRWFRPPQGLRVPTLRDALARAGASVSCVTWSVRGMDATSRSAEAIVARVAKGLERGAIITLHDGRGLGGTNDRTPTLNALAELLTMAKARDLACVTLDTLLAPPPAEERVACGATAP